jgi:DNA-binding transcriptional MerR regulator
LAPQTVTTAAIPNRPVFRAQEVCEIAQVQPYVLRSWEAEFPDLGVSKRVGEARVYRRADVEKVLHLKHLLFVDGLTLAGARKRLGEERGAVAMETGEEEASVTDAEVAAMMDQQTRQSLREVRRGLQWILGVLAGGGVTQEDRVLVAEPIPVRAVRAVSASGKSRNRSRPLARKTARVVKRSAKGRKR